METFQFDIIGQDEDGRPLALAIRFDAAFAALAQAEQTAALREEAEAAGDGLRAQVAANLLGMVEEGLLIGADMEEGVVVKLTPVEDAL